MPTVNAKVTCPVMPSQGRCLNFNERLCPYVVCHNCPSFIPKEWRKMAFVDGQWYMTEEAKKTIGRRGI